MYIKLFYIFALSSVWLIFSGIDGILHYPILSFFSIALILFLIIKIPLLPSKIYNPISTSYYIFWLIKEIIISSLQVAKIIWNPKSKIKPTIMEIDTKFAAKSAEITLYANSMTLTPGTIAIDTKGTKILVHCLNTKFLRGLASGDMQKRLYKVFSNDKTMVI